MLTRWISPQLSPAVPLPVIAPEGSSARFVRRMLDPFDDDIALRVEHVQPAPPVLDLRAFDRPTTPGRRSGARTTAR